MPPTSTEPRRDTSAKQQPDFWAQYSPNHECPISFSTALVLWVLIITGAVAIRFVVGGSESNKPPQMDIVEIEGGGGGLGGSGTGPGLFDKAPPSRNEGELKPRDDVKVDVSNKIIPQFALKPLDNSLIIPADDDPDLQKIEVNPFAAFENLPQPPQNPLPARPGDAPSKPGKGKGGDGGGGGGPAGPGQGNKVGPGKGSSPTGSVLTDQRRRELRWRILASDKGEVHLKKLQALKCTLIIPLRPQPGEPLFALKYDFTKASMLADKVRAVDDSNKVRWKNSDPKEMLGLAQALGLNEVPQYAVIYLPSELERNMAERELAYQGRKEGDIQMTVWDVRQRDGGYDNEPHIVQQVLRPGVK